MSARLSIKAEDLQASVDFAVKLCSTKPSLPTLHGVLVEADNHLTMSAFDGDIAGHVTVSADVFEPGSMLVPGRWLALITKTMSRDDVVDLTYMDDKVTIAVGRNRWSLPTMNIADYPDLPKTGAMVGKVDSAVLHRAITRVLPAAERPGQGIRFLASVSMIGDAETLAVCATDGWRLAVAYVPWGASEPLDVLVPYDVLSAAAALGPEGNAAGLAAGRGLFTLDAGVRSVTGRLTSGRWPLDWQAKLATAEHAASATFVVDELRAAVDRVLAVSDDKHPGALMTISRDGFELSGWSAERDGVAVASASDYDAEPRTMALNPWFLRGALNALGSDLAALRFGSRKVGPLDFVPLDDDGLDDQTYRHLLMPQDPSKLNRRSP